MRGVDGRFLGTRQPVVFWFAFSTLLTTYYWKLRHELSERARRLAPESARSAGWMHGVPISGRPGWRQIVDIPEPEVYVGLDGLTLTAWTEREMPALADSGAVTVSESVNVRPSASSHIFAVDGRFNTQEFSVDYVNGLVRNIQIQPMSWRNAEQFSFSWAELSAYLNAPES